MDRRNFIKQASQYTLAAGLAAMTSYLVFREKSDEECNLDFACQNCSKNEVCKLPEKHSHNTNK